MLLAFFFNLRETFDHGWRRGSLEKEKMLSQHSVKTRSIVDP